MLIGELFSGMRNCECVYAPRKESRGKERTEMEMTEKQPKEQGSRGVTRVPA